MIRIATIVKDEAHRYWGSALRQWATFADYIIVIDDDSTDETKDMAEEAGCDVFTLFDNTDMWGNETPHRAALFAYAMGKADPGDIVFWLDADMVPARDPSKFFDVKCDGYSFCLYDLWGQDSSGLRYRSDNWWRGHENPRVWALRVPDDFDQTDVEWGTRGIHSGHIPGSWFTPEFQTMVLPKDMGLLHYGYYTERDRQNRYDSYIGIRHKLSESEFKHATTIMDPDPKLLKLPFTPELELERAT